MKRILMGCVILGALSITACQNYTRGQSDNAVIGTVIGAAGGGLIGSTIGAGTGQVVATATGAIFGGIFGNQYGQSMDETDRIAANGAFNRATGSEIGQTEYWHNAPTGHNGSIRPIRDSMFDGLYCREFQNNVYIDGRTVRMYGTACRQKDGRWVAVS